MCDIAIGRGLLQCKTIAGFVAIYFIKTSELGSSLTYDVTGNVTDFGTATTAYKYDLLTGTNIDDDAQSSSDTGTQFNTIAGTITLIGHENTDTAEFDALQKVSYSILGELRNGKAKLFSPN